MLVNGTDDDDGDILPRPSRMEALQAITTVQTYISMMNNPFARKLERLLASFGRQTRLEEMRSLWDTEITAYFART